MLWNPAFESCYETLPAVKMAPWHSFVLPCLGKRTSTIPIYSVFTHKHLERTTKKKLSPKKDYCQQKRISQANQKSRHPTAMQQERR